MTRPSLDDLVTSARRLDVREDHARAYVDELGRWARVEPAPARRWVGWFAAAGLATAAAAIVLVLLRSPTSRAIASEPVRVGDRVALVVAPGTSYRVAVAAPERTEILVDRGTITARLWPGARSHALTLRGHDVTARALGTVYTLSVDATGARVEVHEGRVDVQHGAQHAVISAGGSWPVPAPSRYAEAARQLLALGPPPAPAIAPATSRDAGLREHVEVADAGTDLGDLGDAGTHEAVNDHATHREGRAAVPQGSATRREARAVAAPTPTPADAAAPSPRERWRLARLYRGQGKYDGAIAECQALADARDPVWSPIAIVEAARIELGPRTSPEAAITWTDRFAREWPTHELASEVRELRCRALRQLGREAECAGR